MKTALVTGGGGAIGAAICRRFARDMKVLVADRYGDAAQRVAKEIGGTFCEVNVTSDESVDAGFAKARAAHGQ